MEMKDKYLEKPWLKEHDLMTYPDTLEPYPEMPYTEYHLDEPARKYPNSLALVQFDYEMTYKELKEHVDIFATALTDLGVRRGDVVATVLQTSIQNVIADMAIPRIGAIHTPGSIIDSVDGYVDKWTRANVKTVICVHTNVKERDTIDKVEEAAKQTNVENIIVTHTKDYSKNPPSHPKEEGAVWFTDLIEKYPPNPPKVDIDPKKDVAILFFTGGTTGVPKGCMITHHQYIAQTESVFQSFFPKWLSAPMEGLLRVLMPLPQFHVYGHGETVLMLRQGYTILLVTDPRDMKEWVRMAKKYHPFINIGAPTQYMKILKEEGATNLGMITLSGSMALAPETHKASEKKTGSIMGEGYGLSEFAPVTHVPSVASMLLPVLGDMETVGKVMHLGKKMMELPGVLPLGHMGATLIGPDNLGRILNMTVAFASRNIITTSSGRKKEFTGSIGTSMIDLKMKIIDEDTGETIPMEKAVKEGKRGEMCLDAPWKMLGYWPDAGSGFDEEGYVHTGDVVKLDEWGRTYIVDRTKDMVNVSGYKVYTREMDDLLYEIPGIDEVATVGIPDPDRPGSERIKVFIAPLPEYRGKIKEEDVIKFLRGKVAPYAVPKSVEIRDELPRTVTEKIFKKQLREEEIEKMKKEGILK